MKVILPVPLNRTQREFQRLCELGGGPRGGPAPIQVKELLRASGRAVNNFAYREAREHFAAFPSANPWHICFAVGLAWGHLAKFEVEFTEAVAGVLTEWNDDDLRVATTFHLERGPEPIEQSLRGAHALFSRVTLPPELPNTLRRLSIAQERWLSPILGSDRPRYIGSWNATAMFMTALFAQPSLAATLLAPPPILPPGGPIFSGMQLLHRTGVLGSAPEGSQLDDQAFEPGALYINNERLAELRKGLDDWSLLDVHSGVYMLGTRDPRSDTWT